MRRETRGFSRAQTGDALTSVVPLAWSVSMLMHASLYSFNFDDNTAGTTFSFNVLAYQWGWNYYFPSDLLRVFRGGPKRVGHGGVESFELSEPYSTLLSRFRYEHVRRLSLQGEFVSQSLPVLSPLTLFAHTHAPEHGFEPVLALPLSPNTTCDFVGVSLAPFEAAGAPFFSSYAWLGSSPLFRFLAPLNSSLALRGGQVGAFSLALDKVWPSIYPGPSLSLVGPLGFDLAISPTLNLQPGRALSTLSLGGNKLYLIHRHLTALRTFTPAVLFSPAPSVQASPLYASYFPSGVLSRLQTQPVVSAANLVSVPNLSTDGPATHEHWGLGLLSLEDFGLTSGAAVRALMGAGVGAAQFCSTPSNFSQSLSFFSLLLAQTEGSFFSSNVVSD